MANNQILWVDDEIDMLRPHILFLKEKGYEVTPINNGAEAIDLFKENDFDIVFLDENMPGLSGLETLNILKSIDPNKPIVMITKNEDEGIMTDAIGKKIADYLIKPVNPHQILLSLKKNLHKDDIVSTATLEGYREQYAQISVEIGQANSFSEWEAIYKKLIYWDLELTTSHSPLIDLLRTQYQDANKSFTRFIKVNYQAWIEEGKEHPTLSNELLSKRILPQLEKEESVFFILLDNFRLDQWMAIKDILSSYFSFAEDTFCSILPTATHYARNAIFSGLMPNQIKEMYPNYWAEEDDEGSKNQYEGDLIGTFFERYRKKHTYSYNHLTATLTSDKYIQQMSALTNKNFNVLVINFIDMLSHARTESKMIRELASDEAAYRSLTRSWFEHSGVLDIFKRAAELSCKVVLTTDHGTIRVKKAQKVVGEKELNTNLRYKVSHNIEYDRKKVYDILKPEKIGLPTSHINTKFIFASEEDFFAYPNNFNYYVSYYTNTFQHGGISMEEMIVPYITMTPKQ